jgi:hypothetical protein
MEIKENLIELVDQLNLNTLPVDNSELVIKQNLLHI